MKIFSILYDYISIFRIYIGISCFAVKNSRNYSIFFSIFTAIATISKRSAIKRNRNVGRRIERKINCTIKLESGNFDSYSTNSTSLRFTTRIASEKLTIKIKREFFRFKRSFNNKLFSSFFSFSFFYFQFVCILQLYNNKTDRYSSGNRSIRN